jgi:hypothetical protein
MQPQFRGQLVGGLFKLDQPQIFKAYCKGQKEGDYYLTIHKAKGPPKTLAQLAYYHAVILPTVQKQMVLDGHDTVWLRGIKGEDIQLPLTADTVDLLLKLKCAVFEDWGRLDKADMDIDQAREFITRCQMYAAQYLNCVIPDPRPNDQI